MSSPLRPIRGRGADRNPANRFTRIWYEPDPDLDAVPGEGEEPPRPPTELLRDASRSVISRNDSPDVPFEASLNPYRGCEHGCIYCYARPTHEYLGFSAGLDFETKILVKEDAPALLRRELSSRRWSPRVLALSGVTDPYQPVERKLRITRRCLEVLAELRNPVCVVTKNRLVTRDLDLLSELARHRAASVFLSVTTLRPEVSRVLEPRTSHPEGRLDAIRELSAAGVPVGVLVAPVLPALTDHEVPAILRAARAAGATFAGWVLLRLPLGVGELFEAWLGHHFPDRKEKVLGRIREMRGGCLDDPAFGSRMRGRGLFAEQVAGLFRVACAEAGLDRGGPELSTQAFRPLGGRQLDLFG